jgi:hypothetical protein
MPFPIVRISFQMSYLAHLGPEFDELVQAASCKAINKYFNVEYLLQVNYKEQTTKMRQFYFNPQGLPCHHIPMTSKEEWLIILLLHADLTWNGPNTIRST